MLLTLTPRGIYGVIYFHLLLACIVVCRALQIYLFPCAISCTLHRVFLWAFLSFRLFTGNKFRKFPFPQVPFFIGICDFLCIFCLVICTLQSLCASFSTRLNFKKQLNYCKNYLDVPKPHIRRRSYLLIFHLGQKSWACFKMKIYSSHKFKSLSWENDLHAYLFPNTFRNSKKTPFNNAISPNFITGRQAGTPW